MRTINPKRDQEGKLYHFCPLKQENIGEAICDGCEFRDSVEYLPTKYRVHCTFSKGGVELIQFKIPKAYAEVEGLRGNDVIKSSRHTWVEPKLDGARALVHCTPDGVFITSRRRNKEGEYNQFQDNVPHLRDHPTLVALGKDGYTILDGEIIMGDTLGSTMGVVGGSPEHAIKIQEEYGQATLYLFDISRKAGQDISYLTLMSRRNILEDTFEDLIHIRLVPTQLADTAEDKQNLLEEAIRAGYEGLVIKDPNSEYGESRAWLKVKQHLSVDAQVTGWHPGSVGGKWENSLGDLAVSVDDMATGELREICTVIPGDDATRARLYAQLSMLNEQAILDLGMIVELEGQGWSKEYRIRHPRILRYRVDRSDPNEVDFSKVERI